MTVTIVLFVDRVVLEQRVQVEKLQDKLVDALRHSIKVKHPMKRGLLARVLGNLVPIRELTIRANIALPKIKKDWGLSCELDPFWKEFIDDSPNWQKDHM